MCSFALICFVYGSVNVLRKHKMNNHEQKAKEKESESERMKK